MIRTLLLALILLPGLASTSHGFGSSAGTCNEPLVTFHSLPSPGDGGFTLVATSAGAPVTQVVSGQTIEVTLSRAAGYKGFLIRANEATANGAAVGGLSVTSPGTQQLEPACTLSGSGVSHVFDASPVPAPRTSDVVSWTVPPGLATGTTVVLSAYPVVNISEWYGAGGTLAVSLEVVEPVPTLHPMALFALVGMIAVALPFWLRVQGARAG
jgi:hypothetical protein